MKRSHEGSRLQLSKKQLKIKENKLQIRNSTAEFLIFTKQAGESTIECASRMKRSGLRKRLWLCSAEQAPFCHPRAAAELIAKQADSSKDHMGLTTWNNAPDGKILKPDVKAASFLHIKRNEVSSHDRSHL